MNTVRLLATMREACEKQANAHRGPTSEDRLIRAEYREAEKLAQKLWAKAANVNHR
jgi:hypothetical protein